ncbi:uncharacterized protein LOC143240745 [Tachypleus tridentatus]|uniref:uncharacterized protein LOC143240745 n=1 Tax=Tachypleus tridentatus TaxID=6853 RepID=UPI003FD62FE3
MPKSFLIKKNQLTRGFSGIKRPEIKQGMDHCFLPLDLLSPQAQDNNAPFDLSLKARLKHTTDNVSVQDVQTKLLSPESYLRASCQCELCLPVVASPESSLSLESISLTGHRPSWSHRLIPPYLPFNFPVYPRPQHYILPPSFSDVVPHRTSPCRPDDLASPRTLTCDRVSPQGYYDGQCSPPSQSLGLQVGSVRQEKLYNWLQEGNRGSVSSGSPREGSDSDSGQDTGIGEKPVKLVENSRYQCSDCKKSYSTFSGLSKHQKFHCITSGKKSFSCKHCDKVYVSLGALKMHIRTHTLPCKCTLCGKAFSRPWLLQGHIRTHTGEKPFSCPHCNRAFADRSNLRAHLQTHSDVKKYRCKSCNKTFSRMSLLVKHEEGVCSETTLALPDADCVV